MEEKRRRVLSSRHRKRYIHIVTVLIILFFSFQIVSNFTGFFLEGETERTLLEEVSEANLYQLFEKKEKELEKRGKDSSYLLVGEEEKLLAMVKNQLRNLKETYEIEQSLTILPTGKKGIFLIKNTYTEEEIQILKEAAKDGISLYFLTLPKEQIRVDDEFRELLGIRELRERKEYRGIRFIADFFISNMIEFTEYELFLYDLTLKQGTKTYAYSLLYEESEEKKKPELRNEELPPIIWRNTFLSEKREEGTMIFCVNGEELIKSRAGIGIITSLLSHSEEDYLYPVINAYSIIIKGMPILTNFSNKKLENLYGKDALGIQQDILTPHIFGFVQKYQIFPTYLSPEAIGIEEGEENLEVYYKKQILVQLGELFGYEERGTELYIPQKNTSYEPWSIEFDFYKNRFPLIQNSNHYKNEDELYTIAANTAYGFTSIYTDIEELLKEDNEIGWVEAGKMLNTLLAVQSKSMNYLERMTLSDSIKRFMVYRLLETQINKQEKEISVTLDYFTGEAFYILKTSKEIEKIEHGTYEKIGNHYYMIKFSNDTARIIYK